MGVRANGENLRDEEHNRRLESTEADTAFSAGLEQQRKQQVDPTEFLTEEFLDTVTELDVDRELPPDDEKQLNIEQKLGAHGSKQLALGNITREEYESQCKMDRARRRLMQMEYRRPAGTGSECTGGTRRRMTGGEGEERPRLTSDIDAQLDAGFEAKKSLRSGSIGGRLLSLLAEAHVVTRSEGFKRNTSDGGGYLSKITGGLLGG